MVCFLELRWHFPAIVLKSIIYSICSIVTTQSQFKHESRWSTLLQHANHLSYLCNLIMVYKNVETSLLLSKQPFGKMFGLWHYPCKGKRSEIHKNIFWSLTNVFFKIASGLCMSDQEGESVRASFRGSGGSLEASAAVWDAELRPKDCCKTEASNFKVNFMQRVLEVNPYHSSIIQKSVKCTGWLFWSQLQSNSDHLIGASV